MRMWQRAIGWAGAAAMAVAIASAAPAVASPIFVQSSTQSPPGAFNITISGLPGANGTYSAGAFTLTASQGTSFNPSQSFTFLSWCVDVFNVLTTPKQYNASPFVAPSVNNAGSPPSVLTQAQVDSVVGLVLAGNGALTGPNTGIFSTYTDQQVSAAVQGAIWKVINPTGTFVSANAGVNALMATIMSNIGTFETAGAANRGQASWLTATNAQGQITGQGQIAFLPVPVPVPGTVLLLGFGLAGLLAARRFS